MKRNAVMFFYGFCFASLIWATVLRTARPMHGAQDLSAQPAECDGKKCGANEVPYHRCLPQGGEGLTLTIRDAAAKHVKEFLEEEYPISYSAVGLQSDPVERMACVVDALWHIVDGCFPLDKMSIDLMVHEPP